MNISDFLTPLIDLIDSLLGYFPFLVIVLAISMITRIRKKIQSGTRNQTNAAHNAAAESSPDAADIDNFAVRNEYTDPAPAIENEVEYSDYIEEDYIIETEETEVEEDYITEETEAAESTAEDDLSQTTLPSSRNQLLNRTTRIQELPLGTQAIVWKEIIDRPLSERLFNQ